MYAAWIEAGWRTTALVQDEDRYGTVACNLLGDASQRPAFEAGLAVATHHNRVHVLGMDGGENGWSSRCCDDFCRDFDASQISGRGNPGQILGSPGSICIDGCLYQCWRLQSRPGQTWSKRDGL